MEASVFWEGCLNAGQGVQQRGHGALLYGEG